MTVDLGMVTGIGYVAGRGAIEQSLRAQGLDEISKRECMALIEAAVARPNAGINILTGVGLGWFTGGDIHHAVYQAPVASHARRLALLSGGDSDSSNGVGTSKGGLQVRIRELLRKSASREEAHAHVLRAVKAKLAGLLMITVEDIDPGRTMSFYGLDSLIAVEMRNWIASEVEATVAILDHGW
ncbi:hypothetical protein B0T25DRAFT_602696 [Lasiosphaeria hispida]|uniref:Carrier domain-containing protein n=1 Tax=Lasiosphaeria hispida TaxID=260671 RepID=A0AAJ0HKM6_9PEZI|nr:hypothetical protein B0T25DRAFT_602696 [Lasiosphaeria hispida]